MYLFDLLKKAEFKEKGPHVQVIAQSAEARYVLFCIREGQQLQEHSTSSQISVQLLSGKRLFKTEERDCLLEQGQLLLLEAHVPHSLTAQTDAVLLLIMTPNPQKHTLATEVFDGIQPLLTLD